MQSSGRLDGDKEYVYSFLSYEKEKAPEGALLILSTSPEPEPIFFSCWLRILFVSRRLTSQGSIVRVAVCKQPFGQRGRECASRGGNTAGWTGFAPTSRVSPIELQW